MHRSIVHRKDHVEDRISEFKGRTLVMTHVKEDTEIKSKKNEILWELYNSIKKGKIKIMGIPEGKG